MFSRDPLANPEPLIRRVYSYAAYRLGDGPDAEDATSDAFERALRYRDSYDRRKGEPTAWLIGIARRSVDQILADRVPLAEPPDVAAATDLENARLTVSVQRLRPCFHDARCVCRERKRDQRLKRHFQKKGRC